MVTEHQRRRPRSRAAGAPFPSITCGAHALALLGLAFGPAAEALLLSARISNSVYSGAAGSAVAPRSSMASLCRMGIAAADDDAKVAVCGPTDGLAGIIVARLASAGGARRVELVDVAGGKAIADRLGGAKVVIISADAGPDAPPPQPGAPSAAGALTQAVLAALPLSAQYVLLVSSPPPVAAVPGDDPDADAAAAAEAAAAAAAAPPASPASILGSFFKPKEVNALALVRALPSAAAAAPRAVVVHTGRLFGAAAGREPVPFLTGPKAEPLLDESYTRQATLLGSGTLLSKAQAASSKRLTVAEAVAQFLELPERPRGAELSCVSIDGPPPSAGEWALELARLDDTNGVQVLSIELESMAKRGALVDWLVESWGPLVLRKVPAALIRSGSRPVRVAPAPEGAAVVWETVDAQLNVVVTGKLLLAVSDGTGGSGEEGGAMTAAAATPGIRVVRVDGVGGPLIVPLVGEEEIVQQLIEGFNAVIFSKGYARRKAAMAVAAPAAVAAAPKVAAKAPEPGGIAALSAAAGGDAEGGNGGESLRPGRGRRGSRRR